MVSTLFGRRAVVIGAGIGGLSAAGALANYFENVIVLERDRLPENISPRSGTPQDRHPHGLLAGGLKALGEIFPGFERDLAGAGAIPVRVSQEIRFERADIGVLPIRDLGQSILCASRPLIESVLRRKVMAIPNVTVRSECRVTEIVPSEADLVVDASGRGALTLTFLTELGWDQPEATEVGIDISYATAVLQMPTDAQSDWKMALTQPNPPTLAIGGLILPLEGDRWIALISDRAATSRVETWDSFLDKARLLVTPTLYNALRGVKPPGGILHHAFRGSSWRHFERLPRLPRGVLPLADALCRFNPIYGQGMSSAAKQARLLQGVLDRAGNEPDPLLAVQAGFMAEVGMVLETPWSMSTSADLAFPTTRGERPDNFEQARQFEAALFRAAVDDPVVHRALFEVMQLLQPQTLLREPHIMERIEAVSSKT
jgi:2-polyprenyl-6-methoxyphenol hydroxylase-like FAD-dependent oxidoreductase